MCANRKNTPAKTEHFVQVLPRRSNAKKRESLPIDASFMRYR